MKNNLGQIPLGLRTRPQTDAPGVRVEVIELRPDGSQKTFAQIDYTPDEAMSVAQGFLACMGVRAAVIL